jgi:hypothetical protein
VVAQKFESLIAAGAVARALERGNVRQRNFEHRRIGKAVTDAIFQDGRTALATARFLLAVGRGRRRRCGGLGCLWFAARNY